MFRLQRQPATTRAQEGFSSVSPRWLSRAGSTVQPNFETEAICAGKPETLKPNQNRTRYVHASDALFLQN